MKKKWLAGLLIVCMALTLLPVSVLASPGAPGGDTEEEAAAAAEADEAAEA